MTKKELRIAYLEKRMLLTEAANELLTLQIKQQLLDSFQFENKKISLFLPISNKNEIDTFLIWNDLISTSCEVYVPHWNQDSNTLTHFHLITLEQLTINQFGIPEPNYGQKISNNELDIVLIPLLTFDKNGYRIGYGKGIYDRFLAECNENTIFIGLSQFETIEKIDDLDSFDIPLHYCVSPNNIYHFEKQS